MLEKQIEYSQRRKAVNEEIQNSGLPPMKMGFLRNLYYKRQIDLEIINNRSITNQNEEIMDYRDFIIQFLK